MENHLDRITVLENVRGGVPTIRGMRITIQDVLEHLSAGDSAEEILVAFPMLQKEDITASLQYAALLSGAEISIAKVA